MTIDIHIHPYCREVTVKPGLDEASRRFFGYITDKTVFKQTATRFGALFTGRGVEDIIRDMDAAGIGKAVIVALDMTTRFNVELVANADVGRLAAMHPDRFIPFASVDPGMGRAAVDKLEEAVEKHGCKGLKLAPPLQGFDFSDARHHPLWEAALRMGLVVWTHASHQVPCTGSNARLGHPMRLETVAIKYPELKIVLGHCGFPWQWETWSMVVRHPNVYVDISRYSALYGHIPWDAYFRSGAGNKILFATDYPMFSFKKTLNALNEIEMSDEARDAILSGNAMDVLGL